LGDEEREPFARHTKYGGVVSCLLFDGCGEGKIDDGRSCLTCTRNNYATKKTVDNYVPTPTGGTMDVDNLVGICEFGKVHIVLAPDWKNCRVFLDGKLCRDVGAIQITAGPNIITQCRMIFMKPKLQV
jgi:hypothetical protein